MIYTLTLNPSLDYVLRLQSLKTGDINRTTGEMIYPGGKGMNVSIVLSNLGIANCVMGFLAGFTGLEIERLVGEYPCQTDFIHLGVGNCRINVKIRAEQETDINAQGMEISKEDLTLLFEQLEKLREGDILVLAGSIPKSLPEDIYQRILKLVSHRHVSAVVDATGNLLRNTLQYRPFLIKPNHHELGELLGQTITDQETVVAGAKRLQEMGARNVLVSMAEKGAILVTEQGKIFSSAPPVGILVNSVGAGDAMVAGFLAGYLNTGDFERAFELSLAAGSATAFSDWLAKKEEIVALLDSPEAYGL